MRIPKSVLVQLVVLLPALLVTVYLNPEVVFGVTVCTPADFGFQWCNCDVYDEMCTAPPHDYRWQKFDVYISCKHKDQKYSGYRCEGWEKFRVKLVACDDDVCYIPSETGYAKRGGCVKFTPCYTGPADGCVLDYKPTDCEKYYDCSHSMGCCKGYTLKNFEPDHYARSWSCKMYYCCDAHCNGVKGCNYSYKFLQDNGLDNCSVACD